MNPLRSARIGVLGILAQAALRERIPRGERRPHLAEEEVLRDDSTTVRVTLCRDARFHDGSPVSAIDEVAQFTLRRPHASFLQVLAIVGTAPARETDDH